MFLEYSSVKMELSAWECQDRITESPPKDESKLWETLINLTNQELTREVSVYSQVSYPFLNMDLLTTK